MEWEFTPDDVVQGNVDYALDDFRRDLLQEFRMNLPAENRPAEPERLFAMVYDLCYWLATGGEFAAFEREVGADPYLGGFLRMVHRHSGPNVAMLGAILQRSIMDNMEEGMPLEAALEAVAQRNSQVASASISI